MDPISIIITALVTGAAAALKPTTEQVIKDAYAGLKALICRKYERVNLSMLESDPTSQARQAVVKEDFEETSVRQDADVLQQAKALLDAIQTHAPEVPKAVGLDLEDIKGASLTAERVLAEGYQATGAKVTKAEIQGDITFKDVTARSTGQTPQKKE
jgi:hypothetical protein